MKEKEELITSSASERSLERALLPLQSLSRQSYSGYGVGSETEPDRHIRDYWRSVRKHLWLVIGITMLITMLVSIYMARQPDVFLAQARVQVDLENPNSMVGSKSGSVIINSQANDPTYFNTQLQILSSPGLLERVVKTLDLENNTDLFNPQAVRDHSTVATLLRMLSLNRREVVDEGSKGLSRVSLRPASIAPAATREDLEENERLEPYMMALQRGLAVEPVQETRLAVRETRLIDIGFAHPDPRFAARVVNAVAETYIRSNLERTTEMGVMASEFFGKRIAELQSQIRSGEEQLASYAKNHQILSLDGSQNIVVERLAGLNRQLLEAENDRKLAESTYKVASGPKAAEALAEGNSRLATETEVKLAELRLRRAQLLVENTEKWPEVQELNKQISVLEQQLKDTRERATSVLTTNFETRYQQALGREQALRAAFEKQKSETVTQNEAAINYRILQQEIQTNKGLLDGLLQRAKENDVNLAGTTNNIHVNNYALVPRRAIAPKRLRIIAVSMILSLAFGIGLAIFLEYLDNTVRTSEDIEKLLHLPALAVIPALRGANKGLIKTTKPKQLPAASFLRLENGKVAPELLLHADSHSPLAEAYRQLRTSVLLSTAGRAPRTLLITSTTQGEGKTTTAVNIAISLAQTGAEVLLVDGDLRRPRLHEIFERSNSRGLSHFLSSEMSKTELLGMIEQDKDSKVHLLTAGSLPPNPAELLGSERMSKLLKDLESSFTYVVIDSPPIASVTDAVLIGSMVDGVLMVVQYGVCPHEVVDRSRQLLQGVGAKIFGVVLNNANGKTREYNYKKYYADSFYGEGNLAPSNTSE